MPAIVKNGIYAKNIPLAPVARNAVDITQTSFTAEWESSQFAKSYRIDVATDVNFTNLIVSNTFVQTLTFPVSSLTANTQYFYRVRAVNDVGTSPNSNTISATTSSVEIPDAPVASDFLIVEETSFQAEWSQVSNATSYRLDVSTQSDFSTFVSGYENRVVNGLSENVTGLTPNTTYFYRVRAVNVAGTSGNSNVVSITTSGTVDFLITPRVVNASGAGTKTSSLESAGGWTRGAVQSAGLRTGVFTPSSGIGNATITVATTDFGTQTGAGASMSYADFTETGTGTVIRHVASANGLTIHSNKFPVSSSDFTDTGGVLTLTLFLRTISAWSITGNPSGFVVTPSSGSGLNLNQEIEISANFFWLEDTFIDFTNEEHTFRLIINP